MEPLMVWAWRSQLARPLLGPSRVRQWSSRQRRRQPLVSFRPRRLRGPFRTTSAPWSANSTVSILMQPVIAELIAASRPPLAPCSPSCTPHAVMWHSCFSAWHAWNLNLLRMAWLPQRDPVLRRGTSFSVFSSRGPASPSAAMYST